MCPVLKHPSDTNVACLSKVLGGKNPEDCKRSPHMAIDKGLGIPSTMHELPS